MRLILSSEDSNITHINNKPYSFRVHLSRPFSFNGNWTVTLTDITIDESENIKNKGLLVCSNICEDSIVGENELPILNRIYTDGTLFVINHTYNVPIKVKQFQDIHIYIKDESLRIASFIKGRVTLILELSRTVFLE